VAAGSAISGGWRFALWAAPLTFAILAALIGYRGAGLQYDEAHFSRGAIQMLEGGAEPAFYYQPGSWIRIGRRFWPLMIAPYIGTAQEYLLAPAFALARPRPEVARALGTLLAALGLFAFGRALASWVSPAIAAATLCILSIHPGLLLTILYDEGQFAQWIACLGLFAVALSRYGRRPTWGAAFLLGASAGFAVWCRANFLWVLVPMLLAAVLVQRSIALAPVRHVVVLLIGGVVGSVPLILYEIHSRLGTLRYAGATGTRSALAQLAPRLRLFGEALLCDRDRTAIWGGRVPPLGEAILLAIVVAAGCVGVFLKRGGSTPREHELGRIAAITLVAYLTLLFHSGLNVVGHHFVAVLPIEALVVVLGFRRMPGGHRARWLAGLAFAAYAALALSQVFVAARGIRRTGGVRYWSDAIDSVSRVLREKYPRRDVYALDWGFDNNLFAVSEGQIVTTEAFWEDALSAAKGNSLPLPIDPDAVYLTHAPGDLMFPETTRRFRASMARIRPAFQRTRVFERDGRANADIYAVPGREAPHPRILQLIPPSIVAGRPFNVQPTGGSALVVVGSGFSRIAVLRWNEVPLLTTFGNAGLLTALVPERLYARPGLVRIAVDNRRAGEDEARADIVVAAVPVGDRPR
jgi:hypothetical protein